MVFGFVQDVPADEGIYRQIKALLPGEAPPGLIAHLAVSRPAGLRYIDVWDTEASWERFRRDHVEPAVGKVLAGLGIADDHDDVKIETLEVVDVWLGDARP